ncbi:MAG: hypothetical protein CME19_01560 [Gemmatimonadetes bacterium]|nr:hypothetical protein [Gemmatimonadota bacterium]
MNLVTNKAYHNLLGKVRGQILAGQDRMRKLVEQETVRLYGEVGGTVEAYLASVEKTYGQHMIKRLSVDTGISEQVLYDTGHLLIILLRDRLKLVVLAAIVATPLAVLLCQNWSQDFATHITLTAVPFLIAPGFCFFSILLVVSYHSMRALRTNPVRNLRQE